MKHRTIVVLLAAIAVLLAGNLIVQLMPERASSETKATDLILSSAQAAIPNNVPVLTDRDGYFITSDTTGQNVYLFYFDRSATRDRSDIRFVAKARAD